NLQICFCLSRLVVSGADDAQFTPSFPLSRSRRQTMSLNPVVMVIAMAFLITSEALSASTLPNQVTSSSRQGFLRTASTTVVDDEERGTLQSRIYMTLSRLAKKGDMDKLSDKLEHKSWRTSGENPQKLFMKNKAKWKGKTDEQLKGDREFAHYLVLADVWPKVQYKKGTWLTSDQWIKQMNEEGKKRTAVKKL
ncbi:hypothetical protein L914_03991, partial [Phytophthora nicotianae]